MARIYIAQSGHAACAGFNYKSECETYRPPHFVDMSTAVVDRFDIALGNLLSSLRDAGGRALPLCRFSIACSLDEIASLVRCQPRAVVASVEARIEAALRTLLGSTIAIWSLHVERALGDAAVALLERSMSPAAGATSLALHCIRIASGSAPPGARSAALSLVGDIANAFGSAIAPAAPEIATSLMRIAKEGGGASIDSGPDGGAAASIRASATSALYRVVESTSFRHGSDIAVLSAAADEAGTKVLNAVLRHTTAVTARDASIAVRLCLGPLVQAIAVASNGFSRISIENALSAAAIGLSDTHGGVRLGAALGLASVLATSVAVTTKRMESGVVGGSASAANNANDKADVTDKDASGAGADDGEESFEDLSDAEGGVGGDDDDGDGGSGGAGGGVVSAGATDNAGANSDNAVGVAGSGAISRGVGFMNRLGAPFRRGGADDSSPAPAGTGSGGASSRGILNVSHGMSAADAVELSSSLSDLASPTPKAGTGAFLSALAGLRGASRTAASERLREHGFTALTAIAYMANIMRGAGRLASKKGIRAGDIRAAAAIGTASLLRTLRVSGGGISDEQVAEIVKVCLGTLAHAPTPPGNARAGELPSLSVVLVASGSVPPSGVHVSHLIACVSHAIWSGLAAPPSAPSSTKPAKWTTWQAYLLGTLLRILSDGDRVSNLDAAFRRIFLIPANSAVSEEAATTEAAAVDATTTVKRSFGELVANRLRIGAPPAAATSAAATSATALSHSARIAALSLATKLVCCIAETDTVSKADVQTLATIAATELTSPVHALRLAAIEAAVVCVRVAPSLSVPLLKACLEAAASALSFLTVPGAAATVAAAAAAASMGDAAALAQQRREVLAATTTPSTASSAFRLGSRSAQKVAPGKHTMCHNGASPATASAGGFGVPGAGPGSGCGVITGDYARSLQRLHGTTAAAASIIAESASTLSKLSAPVIDDALALSCLLNEAARDAANAGHGKSQPQNAMASSAAAATAAAASALAHSASAAALAELEAGLTRAAAAIVAAVASTGSDLLLNEERWPIVHTFLARGVLRARRALEFDGIGSVKDGSGAFVLSSVGVPTPVSSAAALFGGSNGNNTSNGLDDNGDGVVYARGVYSGLASAWAWSCTAAVMGALRAVTVAVSPSAMQPALLGQMVRLTRLSLSIVLEAPVIPAASLESGGSGGRQASAAALMRGRAGEIFEAAGASTTLRFQEGAAIALPAALGMNPMSPPRGLAVNPLAGGAADTHSTKLENKDAAGGNGDYSADFGSWLYSPCGTSLAAIALARRSVLHAATSALEAAASLPADTTTFSMSLRRPAFSAAFTILSGASLSLSALEIGLVSMEPRAGVEASAAARSIDTVLDGTFGRSPKAQGKTIPDSHDSTVADLAISGLLHEISSGIGPVWSPLSLSLSFTPPPAVPTEKWRSSCDSDALLLGGGSSHSWDEDTAGECSEPLAGQLLSAGWSIPSSALDKDFALIGAFRSSPRSVPLAPRAAAAAIDVIAKSFPYLPLGTANSLVAAVAALLRLHHGRGASGESAVVDEGFGDSSAGALEISASAGFRLVARCLSSSDAATVARNAATALLSILLPLRSAHVSCAEVEGDNGSSSSFVPWFLGIRAALGLGITSPLPLVRRICCASMANLARLGGVPFTRKLAGVLQKRLRAPSEALEPPARAGIIFAIASIQRALAGSDVGVDHSLLLEVSRSSFAPVRGWALHSWAILLESAIVAASNGSRESLQALIRPSLSLLHDADASLRVSEGERADASAVFSLARISFGTGSGAIGVVPEPFAASVGPSGLLGKAGGATVNNALAPVIGSLVSRAHVATAAFAADSWQYPGGGGVAYGERMGGVASLGDACAATLRLLALAARSRSTGRDGANTIVQPLLLLPVFDPATGDILTGPALIAASMNHTGSGQAKSGGGSPRGNKSTAADVISSSYLLHIRALSLAGGASAARCIAANVVASLEQPRIVAVESGAALHDHTDAPLLALSMARILSSVSRALALCSGEASTPTNDEDFLSATRALTALAGAPLPAIPQVAARVASDILSAMRSLAVQRQELVGVAASLDRAFSVGMGPLTAGWVGQDCVVAEEYGPPGPPHPWGLTGSPPESATDHHLWLALTNVATASEKMGLRWARTTGLSPLYLRSRAGATQCIAAGVYGGLVPAPSFSGNANSSGSIMSAALLRQSSGSGGGVATPSWIGLGILYAIPSFAQASRIAAALNYDSIVSPWDALDALDKQLFRVNNHSSLAARVAAIESRLFAACADELPDMKMISIIDGKTDAFSLYTRALVVRVATRKVASWSKARRAGVSLSRGAAASLNSLVEASCAALRTSEDDSEMSEEGDVTRSADAVCVQTHSALTLAALALLLALFKATALDADVDVPSENALAQHSALIFAAILPSLSAGAHVDEANLAASAAAIALESRAICDAGAVRCLVTAALTALSAEIGESAPREQFIRRVTAWAIAGSDNSTKGSRAAVVKALSAALPTLGIVWADALSLAGSEHNFDVSTRWLGCAAGRGDLSAALAAVSVRAQEAPSVAIATILKSLSDTDTDDFEEETLPTFGSSTDSICLIRRRALSAYASAAALRKLLGAAPSGGDTEARNEAAIAAAKGLLVAASGHAQALVAVLAVLTHVLMPPAGSPASLWLSAATRREVAGAVVSAAKASPQAWSAAVSSGGPSAKAELEAVIRAAASAVEQGEYNEAPPAHTGPPPAATALVSSSGAAISVTEKATTVAPVVAAVAAPPKISFGFAAKFASASASAVVKPTVEDSRLLAFLAAEDIFTKRKKKDEDEDVPVVEEH